MKESDVNINPPKEYEESLGSWVRGWLRQKVQHEKLMNIPGMLLFLSVTVCMALVAGYLGLAWSLLLTGVLVGAPVLVAVVVNLRFGLLLLMVLMFTVLGIARVVPGIPVGISFDIFTIALTFGLIVRQSREKNWNFARNPVSYVFLIWIVFNLLLLFNPDISSRSGWVYTIRSIAVIMVLYFVFLYAVRSISFVYAALALWLGLAFLGALYGIFQDTVGLRGFEMEWLMADPVRYRRYFQFGNIRVWSFFSGPMVFGILMSLSGVAALMLTLATKKTGLRLLLLIMAAVMFWAMLASGTRAAYIVPVVAAVVYLIMHAGLKEIMLVSMAGLVFWGVINVPTSNDRLRQFQSAFSPDGDASFEVRVENRELIQPYILSHPLGGGLGSTGVWGQRFSPNHPLSQFPPDSGFVRTAVESGWIGLLLFCGFMFIILREGIRNYYLITDPHLRTLQLVFLVMIFSLIVTNYPQESILSPPLIIIFLLSAAAVTGLKHVENPPAEPKSEPTS